MTSFGRTTRQNAIWDRLNVIRAMYDQPGNLQEPEDGMPDDDDVVALQAEFVALVLEYAEIHTANSTFG